MHILYLTSGLTFGGAQNITVGLAEQAVRAGHDASIVTICSGNDYRERLSHTNIPFYSLEYDGAFGVADLMRIIQLRRRLTSLIERIDPDLIHEQLFIPKLVLFGMSGIAGKPVIHTQQDNSPWWKGQDIKSRCQTLVEQVFSRRTAVLNTAISESVMRDMQAVYGIAEDECHLIPNFIDESFRSRLRGRTPDHNPKKVFMVTRLVWEKKGLDTAVQVIKDTLAHGLALQLIVVGEGPDRARMERAVEEEELTEYVEFRGYTSNVQSAYEEADVVLMPSRWEGFGITALEAAAHGVPVIAGRVGGLQEVVQHGETGFTCSPEDIVCFVECLHAVLTDDALYRRLSENAIERAKMFAAKRIFHAYEELYRVAARD